VAAPLHEPLCSESGGGLRVMGAWILHQICSPTHKVKHVLHEIR
jgi:hypothetical protein